MNGQLNHLRVVDLTSGLGGYCGHLLAELGAEVIKIEPPGGDPDRAAGDGLGWRVWNVGKRSVCLDGRTAAGGEALRQLVARANIVVRGAELPVGLSADWRGDTQIEVVILPFSAGGGLEGRPATDLTLMARSGLMAMIGDPDRAPLTMPGEQAYALAGIQGAIGALTAWHALAASGRGQTVQVSALQSAVLANYRDPLVWAWTGRIGQRTGNLLVRGASGVRQVWTCADGYVTWSIVDNPGMMRAMVACMAADGQAGDLAGVEWDKLLVADLPRATLAAWEAQVAAYFARHDKATLAALSEAHGLGLSRIDGPAETLDSEHLTARGLWREVRDPEIEGAFKAPGPLFLTTGPMADAPASAPRLGEANAAFGLPTAEDRT